MVYKDTKFRLLWDKRRLLTEPTDTTSLMDSNPLKDITQGQKFEVYIQVE
jgi:hypothetical protein